MSRKLYDHHRVPVGTITITKDIDDKEKVFVRMFDKNALFPDSVVPIEVFERWKKDRNLKEETELGQLNMWEKY